MIKISGKTIFKFSKSIWSYNRSLTGKGVEQTLKKIKLNNKSLKIIKIKTDKKVFDWKIPSVWEVKKAYILTPQKKKNL